ncbi:MAG: hypothetical protein CVU97_05845 [Firmicutes bacterium HGW-Firmicutes-21]|nr:MAG: hypothetical protein CVU97_05845 [Firmicutes bacterium HGW-Firmicutes-21]
MSESEVSKPDDNSGNNSENNSIDVIDPVDDGETFTAVIVGKDKDGLAASIIYVRINEKTKRFSFSYIPNNIMIGNSVGADVPLVYLLPQLGGNDILKKVSALTGMRVDYYAVIGADELNVVVEKMNEPYINVTRAIRYPNPEFAHEYEGLPVAEIPEEYFTVIPAGRNIIDDELITNIMNYNPKSDGSEYHVLIKELYEEVFEQFFTNSGTKNNNSALHGIINAFIQSGSTNITPEVIERNMHLFFTYDVYTLREVIYPVSSQTSFVIADWSKAIPKFKEVS